MNPLTGPSHRLSRRRLALVVALHVLYVPGYLLAYTILESYATVFSAIPVVATAWAFGVRGGFLDSILIFLLSLLLRALTNHPVLATDVPHAIAGVVELVVLGTTTGWLWDFSRRLGEEQARRQQAMVELQQLKEFNENIVQSMGEGLAVEDYDGYMTFVNAAAAAMLGYTIDELRGQHWTLIVPPEQRALIEAVTTERLAGVSSQYELDLVRKDGTCFPAWVSGSPLYERERVVGTLAVFMDITARRAAEAALRENEARYRALFEGVPVGLYRSTPDGVILDANGSMLEMLGYPDRDALLATPASDLYVDLADRERWQEQLARQGVVRAFETRLRRLDGAIIWVEDNAQAERGPNGSVHTYQGNLQNITAR
ncbi:MAG: PAS domain-containing protein, partial [Anaerolineae bacterium]|nr:PAS domain-containing protein [Anaerolineae bacterium]